MMATFLFALALGLMGGALVFIGHYGRNAQPGEWERPRVLPVSGNHGFGEDRYGKF